MGRPFQTWLAAPAAAGLVRLTPCAKPASPMAGSPGEPGVGPSPPRMLNAHDAACQNARRSRPRGVALAETVNRLKAQPGGDIITYGGSTLVRDLIARGLLDELHLFVNPTAIGAGMPVFPNLGAHQQLRLVTARPFDCGITVLHLEPKRS